MCSVVGCESWRRGAQRFNLPEDSQMRLPWIQFVVEASGQLLGHLKEASVTDITVCREHFLEECFEKPVESDRVKLKPDAVPTVRIKSEADESMNILQQEVPVKTEDEAGPIETVSQRTEHTLYRPQAELLQDEDKPLMNNNFLFELFVHKCPSCGYSLQTTTITQATVITLTQQCPLCEYRNEFKRQIISSETDHQSSTGSIDVAIKEEQTDEYPCDSETFGPIENKSNVCDEEEKGHDNDVTSVKPDLAKERKTTPRRGTEGKSHGDKLISGRLTVLQLCTECGAQACEHKSKLYVCDVCGKKCANNVSLSRHTYTHDESYEYRCKFCHATFKKRSEKILHEQIHDYSPKPYKCLVCPETFASISERSIHLKSHRNRKKSKCDICGFIFTHYHLLQRHMVVHTGVKPYKCSLCERAFNQQGHLKSHMRLHTGERPYKCQYCDKAFNHNVSLKSHVQRYHKSDCCFAQP